MNIIFAILAMISLAGYRGCQNGAQDGHDNSVSSNGKPLNSRIVKPKRMFSWGGWQKKATTGSGVTAKTDVRELTAEQLNGLTREELIELLNNKSQIINKGKGRAELAKQVNKYSLYYSVKNHTGHKIFVVGCAWMKKTLEACYRWHYTPVYELEPNEKYPIFVGNVPNGEDMERIAGYLGVFVHKHQAQAFQIETAEESNVVNLPFLNEIKGKTIELKVDRYGFKENLDYRIDEVAKSTAHPSLNFYVENRTGQDLSICCFIYQQPAGRDAVQPWGYTKTEALHLAANQTTSIDVSTITNKYNWDYMRGTLGVWKSKHHELAEKLTYEQTYPKHCVKLGQLSLIAGKKIVLGVERYGIGEEWFDFSVKSLNRNPREASKIERNKIFKHNLQQGLSRGRNQGRRAVDKDERKKNNS